MGIMARLLLLRCSGWHHRTLPSEVIVPGKRFERRAFALAQVVMFALICMIDPPVFAQQRFNPNDFADVTLRTGKQLVGRFEELGKNENVRVAVEYFAAEKMKSNDDGLAELKLQKISTKESFAFFFIPFAPTTVVAAPQLEHIVLVAEGAKGKKVLLGDIAPVAPGKEPEVKDEKVVVDGKIQPGRNQLKSWLRCSLITCAPAALGCATGGAAWAPCFCLWCGGGVAACGINELLD